jgi:ribonuclease HI
MEGNFDTIKPSEKLRWLGFFFDRKLSFHHHVSLMAERAKAAMNGLSILGNSVRGASIASLRTIYIAGVRTILTYGCQLWYRGKQQKQLIKKLEVVQNIALRRICGAFKTTNISALQNLAAIPPIEIYIIKELHAYSLRLNKLPSSSAIISRLPSEWRDKLKPYNNPPLKYRGNTNLLSIANKGYPKGESYAPSAIPPWTRTLQNLGVKVQIDTFPKQKTEQCQFITKLQSQLLDIHHNPGNIIIYTDGSSTKTKSGGAFIAYRGETVIHTHHIGLGSNATSHDGEISALAAAATWADSYFNSAFSPIDGKLYICSDSKSGLSIITGNNPKNSRTFYTITHKHITNIIETETPIHLIWTPGHAGIPGNERADKEAAKARESPSIIQATTAYMKNKIQTSMLNRWTKHHKSQPLSSGWGRASARPSLKLNKSLKSSPFGREVATRTIQVITGHCFCGEYYQRMNLPEIKRCLKCGSIQTRSHIIQHCNQYKKYRNILSSASADYDFKTLGRTESGIYCLMRYLKKTGAFTKTGHPYKGPPLPSAPDPAPNSNLIRIGNIVPTEPPIPQDRPPPITTQRPKRRNALAGLLNDSNSESN